MTNPTEDPDEVVYYDGFGAPIYGHAIGVGPIDGPLEEMRPLGWVADYDIEHPHIADDKVLRSWGTRTPVEISLRIEGDAMIETLALLTGYDFRLPLCEQQIPCRGQE